MDYEILKKYSEGIDRESASKILEMLTNAEYDWAIQNDYENIKGCIPAWTATRIRYKAGATEAEIWNIGEKKKTKIFLPREDGWYIPDEKYGIPNGEPSNRENPKARYLARWQDRDYDGLLSRGDGYNDYGRRIVDASSGPYLRRGVAIRTTKGKKKIFEDKIDWKVKHHNLVAKLKQLVEAESV